MAKKSEFRKKNGERCGADAQTGKSLCVFHDPDKASEGHRARRAGGITRSRPTAVLPQDTPDHPLESPKHVSDLLADSVNRLHRGQLDPRVANAMGYLSSVLLRALEHGPMEERLAHLEAMLCKSRAAPSDRALMRFRRRLEQVEEQHWRRTIEALDRYLEGRSAEDVEFFCVQGYLPEIPIPGRPFEAPLVSWNERWKHWKEFQRMAANKTREEREFFCVHGYWPTRAKER